MAVVYRGWHVPLDQPIAIKVLKDEFAQNREAVARFLREARAGARLRGKHVAQVLDIGRIKGGAPFMVTELLQGETLGERLLRVGPLQPVDAVKVLILVCDAIAEAHDSGFVHRDLKPDNLFLAVDPEAGELIKVLDFGVAKHIDGKDALTRTQRSLGSPHYMAPEQFVQAATVDVRADIWSLGIVLYELLTGRVPFDAPTVPGVCALVLQRECPAPSAREPRVSPELDRIVLCCLDKNPSQRYTNVYELRTALQLLDPQIATRLDDASRDSVTQRVVGQLPPEFNRDDEEQEQRADSVLSGADATPGAEATQSTVGTLEEPQHGASGKASTRVKKHHRALALLAAAAAFSAVVFVSEGTPARIAAERNVIALLRATSHAYQEVKNVDVPVMLTWSKPAPLSRSVAAIDSEEEVVRSLERQLRERSPHTVSVAAEATGADAIEDARKLQSKQAMAKRARNIAAGAAISQVSAVERRYAINPGSQGSRGSSQRTRPAGDLINPYPDVR
jgi:serine/threonine-protein kinase